MKVLIDGMNIVMRSHHVFDKKGSLQTEEGLPTGMVYGFLRSLIKWNKTYVNTDIIVCWDDLYSGSDYRRQIYPLYKAGRPEGGLGVGGTFQMEMLQKMLMSLEVRQASALGAEADDIIATIRRETEGAVIIITSDKDMLQLVGGSAALVTPSGKAYDAFAVKEEFGVPPEYLKAYRSLDGDPSDNLPRVKRLRKKVISDLVNWREGRLERIYENEQALKERVTPNEYERLMEFKEQAFVNEQVSTLRKIEDIDFLQGKWDEGQIEGMCDILEFGEELRRDLKELKKQGFMKTSKRTKP